MSCLLNRVDAVLRILESSRLNSDGQSGYSPFEKSAVETIASHLTEITPLKIVNTMQQVIEEVRLAENDPDKGPVSMDFLDEHDIVEEVIGDAGGA